MDSFERVFAALENRPIDRPPVFPQIGDHAGIINGLTYNIMYENAEKAAQAHLKALDLYGYDFISIQVEPSWPVAEACGAKVSYPPDKNPWITSYSIKKEEDLESFEVPDFLTTKSSKVMIDGTEILAEQANVPIVAFMAGPLTFSLQLMPYEAVMKRIITNPDFIHQLVNKSVLVIKAYVRMLKEAGASILVICEHDIQLIAPRFVREFSFNYLPTILKIYDYNILHMCGRITPHLKASADYLKNLKRLNTVSIGPYVNIGKTQELLDNKIGVAGNVDHIRLLPSGTPQQIETAVHTAIKNSGGDSRFMVAPGCEITSDTPIENVKALVRAVETYHF